MVFAGLVVALFGFLVAVGSLGLTASVGGRLVIVLAGLGISLFGITGLLNPAYLKDAIWKR